MFASPKRADEESIRLLSPGSSRRRRRFLELLEDASVPTADADLGGLLYSR